MGLLISGPLDQLLINAYGWRGLLIIAAGISLHISLIGQVFRPISQYIRHSETASTSSTRGPICSEYLETLQNSPYC